MTRIMLRYVAAVLVAYSLSLLVLFLAAWNNRHEAPVFGGLSQLVEVAEDWQSGIQDSLVDARGVSVSLVDSKPPVVVDSDIHSESEYLIFLYAPGSDKALEIRLEEDRVTEAIQNEDRKFLLFCLVSFLIFAAVGAVVSIPFVRQLQKQEIVIEQLADGDLAARVAANEKDPVGRLGKRLNVMAERVEKLVGGQKELLRTVSHELRTPINRSQFLIDLMEGDLATVSPIVLERIEAMKANLIEQDSLIEELLTYSRLDTVPDLNRSNVDLKTLLENVFEQEASLYPRIKCDFDLSDSPLCFEGDERLLRRVFSNLASNAFNHAESKVEVASKNRFANQVELLISNDGGVIAEEDRLRIFEPFVQLENGTGTGLGLAICKKIVDMHGGEISFLSQRSKLNTCRVVVRNHEAH